MRKVIFHIDDTEYLRRLWTEEMEKGRLSSDCTPEQIEDILSGLENFRAVYTLYGEGKNIFRYTLTDADGNKININDLNGYQRGCIIGDCLAYFEGRRTAYGGNVLCGVIGIEESEE